MSNYNTALRMYVRSKLAARGWSVAELSRRARLRHTTVDTILRGDGEIHYSKAMALRDAVNGRRVNNEQDQA